MKLKILFVYGDEFHKGGVEAVMLNILKYIDHDNFHIDFMLFCKRQDETQKCYSDIKKYGGTIYYITPRRESYAKNLKEIKSVLMEHKYDIIHSHMDAIGADCLRIGKKCGIKTRIAHSHNTNQLTNPKGIREYCHKAYIEIERYAIRRYATHFIACSDLAGQWLFGDRIVNGKQKRYMVFNNAIDVKKYQFNPEVRDRKRKELGVDSRIVIGHVGRFTYQKNHEYLINIFDEMHKQIPNSVLMLAGDGELEESIKKMVIDKNLDEDVIFLGSRNDVEELMQAFDVFVFPSHYEGLSVALIEAQASGLKCFASSNVSAQADVCGEIDYLDIRESAEVWSEQITAYLKKREIRGGKNTVQLLCRAGYDMETNIKTLQEFYKEDSFEELAFIRSDK